MDSTGLKDLFREEVADLVSPYLWSDLEIFTYLDDAQKMFCRLTGGLPDASSIEATQITYATGDVWVDTHPSILKIRDSYLQSDGSEISVINYEDLPKLGLCLDSSTGPLQFLVIGMEEDKARLLPIPIAADTIQLIVDRLPLVDITDDGNQDLEIKNQHHIHLLLWVKHMAYDKQDAETRDDKKSADFEAKFRAYCEAAKREKDRAKHKTRVVAYGGL